MATDDAGVVHAPRGPGDAPVQGHRESVLSSDGLATLRRLGGHALVTAPAPRWRRTRRAPACVTCHGL
ncbi:hypothetical protein, partial [Cellulomonas sp. GbtcB1]|uniref:hypothetical protein n=1 Tax=Cellulomonas sp. GbtcB1 TaxID=2824746 RepID=UPI001C2F175D